MPTSEPEPDPRAVDVRLDEDELTVALADGRRVVVPLVWFPRLLHADEQQRRNWRMIGDGQSIHCPDLDEDLSVAGSLRGTRGSGAPKRTS